MKYLEPDRIVLIDDHQRLAALEGTVTSGSASSFSTNGRFSVTVTSMLESSSLVVERRDIAAKGLLGSKASSTIKIEETSRLALRFLFTIAQQAWNFSWMAPEIESQ